MFKKKNNLLLAGTVLAALGGMNTASAALPNCLSATVSPIDIMTSNAMGVTDPNVIQCFTQILTIASPLRELKLSALGTFVSRVPALAISAATLAQSLTGAFPAVSRNNLGQALIFPYYTTRDDKKSIINIFNTSDRTVAAKVRFHESHNSRDVLDFTVVLSPYDKWSGSISEGTNGPIFTTTDSTCTVPAIPAAGQPLNSYAYDDATVGDKGSKGVDRLREGYVEVIAMGDATEGAFPAAILPAPSGTLPTAAGALSGPGTSATLIAANPVGNVAYYAKHVKTGTSTKPRDCSKVMAAFVPTSTVKPDGTNSAANISGNPTATNQFHPLRIGNNPLRGALSIISTKNGVGFGTAAVAIENFANPNNENSLISAQKEPFFHEPSLASRDGLWTHTGLPVIEATLAAKTIINEWSNNRLNGANTDWVIQFPTKAFHVDIPHKAVFGAQVGLTCDDTNFQAARNKFRGNLDCSTGGVGIGPTTPNVFISAALIPLIFPFEKRFNEKGSMVTIDTTLIDKEENTDTAAGGVTFSPSRGSATPSIPYESNIVTFSGAGGVSVLSSSSPELALDPVSSTLLTETNGMARIQFPNAKIGTLNIGLPVVGFVAKQRNQGDSALSFGQIMNHSMKIN